MQNAKTVDMTAEETKAFRELPVDDLIKTAMEELQGISRVMSKLRDQPPKA